MIKSFNKSSFVLLGAITLLSGCAGLTNLATPSPDALKLENRGEVSAVEKVLTRNEEVVEKNKLAVKTLFGKIELGKQAPILVATSVSVDDVDTTSKFGRLLSEHVVAGVSDLGYQTIEMKSRRNMLFNEQGEFFLSKNFKEVSAVNNAQAVIVSTYAAANDGVFVTLKLINPVSGVVLAANSYSLEMTASLRSLLYGAKQYK